MMFEKHSDVESDGRMIRSDKDPPGQKCVYINPGKGIAFMSVDNIKNK